MPATIDASEFEAMRDVMQGADDDWQLVEEWFRKDTNAIPDVYVLQRISSKLHGYLSTVRSPRIPEISVNFSKLDLGVSG